jgi:hypothetical protein
MAYRIVATTKSEPSGIAVYFMPTPQEAWAKVRDLLGRGLEVKITGPGGESVSRKELKQHAKRP